jgi:hypothetical protein
LGDVLNAIIGVVIAIVVVPGVSLGVPDTVDLHLSGIGGHNQSEHCDERHQANK